MKNELTQFVGFGIKNSNVNRHTNQMYSQVCFMIYFYHYCSSAPAPSVENTPKRIFVYLFYSLDVKAFITIPNKIPNEVFFFFCFSKKKWQTVSTFSARPHGLDRRTNRWIKERIDLRGELYRYKVYG